MPSSPPCKIWESCKTRTKVLFANVFILCIFFVWTLLALPFLCFFVFVQALRGIGRAQAAREGTWLYARISLRLLSPIIPVHCHDTLAVKRSTPCILVANHQSFLDLYLFGLQDEPNVCMLTKAWPFKKLFFFAPIMRMAGYINVEELSASNVQQFCHQRLQEQVTLIVFPEGKRTRTGALGKFHTGAFQLAIQEKIPVVPMIIDGSYEVFRTGAWYFRPRPITIRFLPPVFPENFLHEVLPHRSMMRHVRGQFMQKLASTT